MSSRYETFVGLRYLMSRRRNRFISFISGIAVLGIALGVIMLTTVLSVVNGFEKSLVEHLLGMEADVTVVGYGASLADWETVAQRLRQHPEVTGAAPYIESEAMLAHARAAQGLLLRGILPELEPQVSFLPDKLVDGSLTSLKPGDFGIIIGAELAGLLELVPGDRLSIVSPEIRISPAGLLPRVKRFRVVALYDTDVYEYDSRVAFVHLDDARLFFRLDRPDSLRLKTSNAARSLRIGKEALQAAPGSYGIIDWTQRQTNYFLLLKMTRKVMFAIVALIIAVACFNVLSTLMMMVTDKRADIAVLRTLGASSGDIMRIFMTLGMALGGLGIVLGVAGGIWLAGNITLLAAWLERLLQVQFLAPDLYYVSELPAELHWKDVLVTVLATFCLTLAATLFPAWRATRARPAEVLRYDS